MADIAVRWLAEGELRTGGVAELGTARASGWAWVDVLEPDEESLDGLGDVFDLHPLALEDCLHYPQRPKIESYQSGIFLIWVTPYEPDGDDVPTHELDVFLGKDHLITVHSEPLGMMVDVVGRADDIMQKGADFLLHAILDRLVDNVLDIVDTISDELEGIEDVLLSNPSPEVLESLHRLRRRLVKLHRIIGPERDIIRALARERELVDEEAYRYLQDVGDHLARVEDSIETAREVAAAVMDIYLSSVSNRMNEIMKVLTVVATIFMPLTLISGIYGMNVIVGMWPPVSQAWSFWAISGFMLALAIWMVWFFRRRKWW
jgi:magnesium transporter